jgi:hypothetical protein
MFCFRAKCRSETYRTVQFRIPNIKLQQVDQKYFCCSSDTLLASEYYPNAVNPFVCALAASWRSGNEAQLRTLGGEENHVVDEVKRDRTL